MRPQGENDCQLCWTRRSSLAGGKKAGKKVLAARGVDGGVQGGCPAKKPGRYLKKRQNKKYKASWVGSFQPNFLGELPKTLKIAMQDSTALHPNGGPIVGG